MILLFLACRGTEPIGPWSLEVDEGALSLVHEQRGALLDEAHISTGHGEADVEFAVGSFRFEDDDRQLNPVAAYDVRDLGHSWLLTAEDADGDGLGQLVVSPVDNNAVSLSWVPQDATSNRTQLSVACVAGEPLMGLGSHAQDVEHRGEAFALWTSEPGVGKTFDDDYPSDWFLTGTRHATSFPMPWLLRPDSHSGLLVDTTARVEVDLCASDADRIELTTWDGPVGWALVSADSTLEVIEQVGRAQGARELPEPWVFAPWNDAVRGPDRVREVVAAIRESGAAGTVIWSEDWKGAADKPTGYHLTGEWALDEELYPDADELADELALAGFQWFAYFSPFLEVGTDAWVEAEPYAIRDADGEPYLFTGAQFEDASLIDLTDPDAQAWVREKMDGALEVGFSGWMADFAEWLPTDAVLASGDAWTMHNAYPLLWQDVSETALAGVDGSFFVRSGWLGTPSRAPVVWLGDQRTSFDADDGFPTVVPLALGLAAGGVGTITHDIGGYSSVGNDPTTEELWFRWAALGAYSPVMRTHHGALEAENFQFDGSDESLEFWARMTREHMRLFPYRYGLAARAVEVGTPMLLHPSWAFEGEDPSRIDAWLLGPSLFVVPVTTQGATTVEVDLPEGRWWDWHTLAEASSGTHDAALDYIPVFVPEGAVIPTYDVIPETMLNGTELPDERAADLHRVVYVFGAGTTFTEADGTVYTASGAGSGEVTDTLTSGELSVGGLTLTVAGDAERTYTLVAVD
ncbi:MAG: hypothetical protein GY884_15615 [Proteobacteria bacterium]|nr:hypothetical protein [Pseudomonadota bacterium]